MTRSRSRAHPRTCRLLETWLGAISMRQEARGVRRRARALMVAVILGMAGLAAVLALILLSGANGLMVRAAEQRAHHGLDMLVSVGANMPDLTPHTFASGRLSPVSHSQLDAAVHRGQVQQVLSAINIWNARGELLYSLDGGGTAWLRSPRLRSQLTRVLRGHEVTFADPSELDLTSGRRTGTLQAFEPLRSTDGRVFGAIEVDLPLEPIVAQTSHERTTILVFVIGGLVVLSLLLLPLTTRASMSMARSWSPGRRRLLRDFQRGLDRDEIELLYQPQIWTRDGSVHGFEALVRWRRAGRLQTPDTFLAVVEGSALMTSLTDRVIELATAQLAAWRGGGYRPRVSINLSARDLEDDTLAARIASALNHHEIPSDQLTVEVTETAILEDTECARRVLTEVSSLGVQIAVDDFGTGHASISRLHQFPIDEVKVDRSFVTPTDARTRTYLKAIIRFTQSLGLRVVAEGIEDEWTLAFLGDLACDVAQGYHIARPLPAGQIQDWLSDNTGAAVKAAGRVPLAL